MRWGLALAEFVRLGEAARHDTSGLGASAAIVLDFGRRKRAAIGVTQAALPIEDSRIDKMPVLIALQNHAAAARQFGHLG